MCYNVYIDGDEMEKEIKFTGEEMQMINDAIYIVMDFDYEEGTKEYTICETITDKIATAIFGCGTVKSIYSVMEKLDE